MFKLHPKYLLMSVIFFVSAAGAFPPGGAPVLSLFGTIGGSPMLMPPPSDVFPPGS